MNDQAMSGIDDLVGSEIAISDWVTVTQDDINRFADATGDHQWIHVDVERAKAESPFGTTIAHGFYTLSLLPKLMDNVLGKKLNARQGINYGVDKARFTAPVPVDSRLRGRFTLVGADSGPMGSVKCRVKATVEIEGGEKPALVAEQIFLLFP